MVTILITILIFVSALPTRPHSKSGDTIPTVVCIDSSDFDHTAVVGGGSEVNLAYEKTL
jgi:hypothetical protein